MIIITVLSYLAESAVHINGGSPNVPLMQPQIVLTPTQAFSPAKTRHGRHSLSKSELQQSTNQNVPNSDQGWFLRPVTQSSLKWYQRLIW